MIYYAYIVIDDEESEDIYKVILNENLTSKMDRSSCKIYTRNGKLILKVYGKDETSFISTISSYLRWIKVYKEISSCIKK